MLSIKELSVASGNVVTDNEGFFYIVRESKKVPITMHMVIVTAGMAFGLLLHSIDSGSVQGPNRSDLGATSNCTPPDCSKNPRNTSCTKPCVGYFCNGTQLVKELCPGHNDSRCTASFANYSAPYPDCCGVVMCS
ncbi:uncharacterized protein LOC142559465 [Dermacentor variabilis]|uniref:uncharacterized protein LOC142559465 n=1 Tax=Dermacentor variabilis TaxID=34621 RepID=UPI003F5C875A